MAAALDSATVAPDTIFVDEGYFEYGGVVVHNWRSRPFGVQDMTGCMQNSINTCLAWVASRLGYAYALCGRVAEGLPLLEQAVERAGSAGTVGHSIRLAYLSEAYLVAGQIAKAIELATRALDLSLRYKERGHQAYALRLLGEIASHRDPPDVEQAEGSYVQAIALTSQLGMRPLLSHCRLGLGRVCSQIGKGEQARCELSAAVELYRSMEMTFWLPRAQAALAAAM